MIRKIDMQDQLENLLITYLAFYDSQDQDQKVKLLFRKKL